MSQYELFMRIQMKAALEAREEGAAPAAPAAPTARTTRTRRRGATEKAVRKSAPERASAERARRKAFTDARAAAAATVPSPYPYKNDNALAAALVVRALEVGSESRALAAELDALRRLVEANAAALAERKQALEWVPMSYGDVAAALLDIIPPQQELEAADLALAALAGVEPVFPAVPVAAPGAVAEKRPAKRPRLQLIDVPVEDVLAGALAAIAAPHAGDVLDALGVDTPQKSRRRQLERSLPRPLWFSADWQ